ncbi:MAG: FMN-binding negative transcriptional regulator [Parvularculaceae bacterium]|nr:FMN-binding negative transcriptional regulator [Parvularculaceae bacterium]
MSYPPSWRLEDNLGAAIALMGAYPFAHVFSANRGLKATRVPFVTDVENDRPRRLRAHFNAQNPQVEGLDGADLLVVFSGPATYVSPHWRASKTRGGTYDYEEVRVRGTARIVSDIEFFRSLINDLSALIEPQYAEVGDYPVWRTSMAPEGYVERLFPAVTPFVVEIASVETISKLHQHFPEEDRRSIADHLSRARRDESRIIAEKIRKTLG